MKKILMIALMMVAVNAVFAQDAISKFFSKYQSDESFSQVTVSSKMFNLFTNMEVESKEDQEVLNAISKLKGLRILAKENTSDARALYKEAFALIPTKEFEELMSVRDKDKDMKFYIKESGGKISELVMIMGGTDDFMVMSLFGEIDLKQVSKIGKKMNVEGLQKLEKMNDGSKKN
jgi:CII-binding regulator of phage lambda lysogenization HflD